MDALVEAIRIHDSWPMNGAGGWLHICTHDGNMRDGDVQFCIDKAREHDDLAGEILARWLMAFGNEEERERLYDALWKDQ